MLFPGGIAKSPNLPDELEILLSTIYHLSEGVVVADKDGRFIIFNHTARSVLGITTHSGNPEAWSEIIGIYKPDGVTPYPPEELPSARAFAGETVAETELFISNDECPSGIWVSVQAKPLYGVEGRIHGSVVVFHDITNKKEADARIQMLTSAVEQTAECIIITDRSGLIEYVNPAFESTTGYTFEELRGLTPRVLNSEVHDHTFYENLWATILSGNVFRDTTVNRRKNGELFYAEQTITPMWGSGGIITHFVTVLKDVTERRKLQEQQFQMELARTVQQQFYEIEPPFIEGYDFAAGAFPADATGGDYFDFVPLSDDFIGIAIGDVCGHGAGSALIMAELRAYVRAFAPTSAGAAELLTLTNNALVEDLKKHQYATLVFCLLNPSTGTITYASAGHTPGFILDANGAVRKTLDSIDIPLGIRPGLLFSGSDPITLQAGDILAFLTDGITDAERPGQELFGVERALDIIRTHCRESARDIVSRLYHAVRDFSKGMPQIDDITMVICKVGARQK
ncbi:MAG TPA: SpoIIE family protein phosphatase [Acidobacteriota bacterium]|nr:SpoIIE family protein phosphatase [Acidobacteriota bacterium]